MGQIALQPQQNFVILSGAYFKNEVDFFLNPDLW